MRVSLVPRTFLAFIPIQTGAEIVTSCMVLNKASAPYGLGALFTGKGLTPMQWILNVMSALALPIAVWGYFGVLRRRPLRSLIYTHLYLLDTLISLGFTVFFIIYWFAFEGRAKNNPGQATDRSVHLLTSSGSPFVPSGSLVARNSTSLETNAVPVDDSKSMTVGQELAMTIVTTTVFLVARFYFVLVLVGYARSLVRQCNLRPHNGEPTGSWRARAQYLLLRPLEAFWTGQKTRARRRSTFGPAETRRLELDT